MDNGRNSFYRKTKEGSRLDFLIETNQKIHEFWIIK